MDLIPILTLRPAWPLPRFHCFKFHQISSKNYNIFFTFNHTICTKASHKIWIIFCPNNLMSTDLENEFSKSLDETRKNCICWLLRKMRSLLRDLRCCNDWLWWIAMQKSRYPDRYIRRCPSQGPLKIWTIYSPNLIYLKLQLRGRTYGGLQYPLSGFLCP